MQNLAILKLLISILLFVTCPALSIPLFTLADTEQAAATRIAPLESRSDAYAAISNSKEPSSTDIALRKRAGRPAGNGITLHALQVTAYMGSRAVLEELYTRMMTYAASQPAGVLVPWLEARVGNIIVTFDSDRPFAWGVIHEFASTMLSRVFNGEQNFYIANIVYNFGQQSVRYVMATPATRTALAPVAGLGTADEAWTAILRQWLGRHGG